MAILSFAGFAACACSAEALPVNAIDGDADRGGREQPRPQSPD